MKVYYKVIDRFPDGKDENGNPIDECDTDFRYYYVLIDDQIPTCCSEMEKIWHRGYIQFGENMLINCVPKLAFWLQGPEDITYEVFLNHCPFCGTKIEYEEKGRYRIQRRIVKIDSIAEEEVPL
jgi:hypothetical protein